MLKSIRNWIILVAAATFAMQIPLITANAGQCQSVAIPAYFYPDSTINDWSTATAATEVGIMILNPDSGPGAAKDTNYAKAVTAAQAAGIKVLGYVYTSYGKRSIATVKKEINKYRSRYRVDGIFLDETSASATILPYYKALSAYIHAWQGNYVMLNPGVFPDKGYISIADAVVVFEDSYSNYVNSWQQPEWLFHYPAEKFVHLIHSTTGKADMQNALKLSAERNAGKVYITDISPNYWEMLPSYWVDELAAIDAYCSAQ